MWNDLLVFAFVLLQDSIPTASPTPTPEPFFEELFAPTATPLPTSQNGGFGSVLWLMLGIGIGIVIGILISKVSGKSQSRVEEEQPSSLSIYSPSREKSPARKRVETFVQRCPVCNSTYTDETLSYCVSDGTSLVRVNNLPAHDPQATMLYPEARNKDVPPTVPYSPDIPSNRKQ